MAGANGALATTTSSGAWQEFELPGIDNVTGVSCPSVSLCVASYYGHEGPDPIGGVLTSTDPTGGAGAWTATNLQESVNGISCPTVGLCVATPNEPSAGLVLTSTDPTGGAGAWATTNTGLYTTLQSVSCASTTLCVAGAAGDTVFSSNPTGGRGSWGVDDAGGGGVVQAVSCPLSSSTCISVGGTGISVGTLVAAHTLSVTVAGSGSGSVRGSSGATGIVCPLTCSSLAPSGSTATLLAGPAPGSFFAGWGKPCTKRGAKRCSLKMSRDETVTATFDADQLSCVVKPRGSTVLLVRPRKRSRPSTDTFTVSVTCDQDATLAVHARITAALDRKTKRGKARTTKIPLAPKRVRVEGDVAKAIVLKLPAAALADLEHRRHEAIEITIHARGVHGSGRTTTTVPTLHAKRA
ncbi:MAG TPA: hypothetical protein VIJ33_08325 [Solirubrobacteraceae bacterium]